MASTIYSTTGGYASTDMGEARRGARQAAARNRTPRAPVQPADMSPGGPKGWTPPQTPVNDTTTKPGVVGTAVGATKGMITKAAESKLGKVAGKVGGVLAGTAGVAQAGTAALDMAENGANWDNVSDAALGALTAIPATRVVGIAGNAVKAGGEWLYDKFVGTPESARQPAPAAPTAAPAVTPAVTPAVASPGIISAAAQQPRNVFTDGIGPPLTDRAITPQNMNAMTALAAQQPRVAAPPTPQTGLNVTNLPQNVQAARTLERRRATLRNAGLRGPALQEALMAGEAGQNVMNPEGQGLISQQRQAQSNQIGRDERAANLEGRAMLQRAQREDAINNLLNQVASLDDIADPGGVARSDIIQRIRALSGDFSPPPETPAETRRTKLLEAALKGGAPMDANTSAWIESAAGGQTNVPQAPIKGDEMEDGNGNRVRFDGRQWVEVK